MKPEAILIIPAYNEEETIAQVIRKSKKYISKILVIDDGSTDNTVEIAKKEGANVISHHRNQGLGKTILTGYKEALKTKASIIVQVDADDQYTISDIPNLIDTLITQDVDLVIASRFQGGIEKMPWQNRLGNKIGTTVTRIVSGFKTTDAQSGFRAMRRELIESIQPTHSMTYVQEMIIRSAKEGWKVTEIPSYFKTRKGDGKSRLIKSLFRYATNAFTIVIRTILEYHALSFFAIPGLILFFLGVLLSIQPIMLFIKGIPTAPIIGTVLLSAFLMISGIILISIGLITDFIKVKIDSLDR